MTGSVSNSVISSNVGLAIVEDDRTNGPINDMRYNGNPIYATTFGTTVYTNPLGVIRPHGGPAQQGCRSRANGTSTDKSQIDNTAPGNAPVSAPARRGAADDAVDQRRRRQPASEHRLSRLRLERRQRDAERQ